MAQVIIILLFCISRFEPTQILSGQFQNIRSVGFVNRILAVCGKTHRQVIAGVALHRMVYRA